MRTYVKEPFDSFSHLFGAVLSIAGLVFLVHGSWGDPWRVVAFSVYGASLVLLYGASALYHGLHLPPRWEDLFRRLDHVAIFVLIAGSYTPVCLVTWRDGWGWSLFGIVWGLAIVGTFVKLFFDHLPKGVSTLFYLGMGWLAVVALVPLVESFSPQALAWLLGGGAAYTAGALVYAWERPNPLPDIVGHHGIFHLFVLAGSVLHFVFLAGYVLPPS